MIFAVFAVQGAWPVPDVNEPYYLGKAIHYWNPVWLPGDFFFESADTHKVFYFAFGWLSLWLSPVALAWTGRAITWLLLAWAWRRLSFAVAPRPWYSVLTAALFACLMDRCHMAGEWVIGGVEAKGFAYVLVLLAIESLVRNRWNPALMLFGGAAAFHVLVGGWSAVTAGLAWIWLRKLTRGDDPRLQSLSTDAADNGLTVAAPPLASLWPGIVVGALLALPGVCPSLTLDCGADAETVRLAHQVYVFERLPHHLTLAGIRPDFILRFALLTVFWVVVGRWTGRLFTHTNANQHAAGEEEQRAVLRRLRAFVGGAVVITLAGVAIQLLVYADRGVAAGLLRFYWFRLSDVAVPLGVALETAVLVCRLSSSSAINLRWSRVLLALSVLIAALHLTGRAVDRLAPAPPRSNKMNDFQAWHAACKWVAESGKIPAGAKFVTPRLAQTFSWYAHRSAVATWKDVPQDAKTMVEWWGRVRDLYATQEPPPEPRWRDSLGGLDAERLRELGAKYDADYAITEVTQPLLPLDAVYANRQYVVYRLR